MKEADNYLKSIRFAENEYGPSDNCGVDEDRMTLFMPFDNAVEWLRQGLEDPEIKELMLYELPEEELGYYPVCTIRGKFAREDGLAKNRRYDWQDLSTLGEQNPDKKSKQFKSEI